MKFYSDLASELISVNFKTDKKNLEYGCKSELIKIDSAKKMKFYSKPYGEYYTLSCENLFYLAPIVTDYLAQELSKYLKEKIYKLTHKKQNKILVACLGNENMVCDSLGKEVFKRLITCEQALTLNKIYAINPSVYGKTNIKSSEHIQAITDKIKPDICIIIDALCTQSISRIASCVQVCDSGIMAGGAVNRSSASLLNKKSLGVPTLCIGIPLVIRIESLFNDFICNLTSDCNFDEDEYYFKFKNVIVAPKNIDALVNQCAILLSRALNSALLGFNKKEQELLNV